jgi:hypothetical protein
MSNKFRLKKNDILFWLGIVTAIWFAWTGMVWTYWAALVIAYPVGFVSLFIWIRIKNENKPRTKIIPIVLVIGLILSLLALTYLLIFD